MGASSCDSLSDFGQSVDQLRVQPEQTQLKGRVQASWPRADDQRISVDGDGGG